MIKWNLFKILKHENEDVKTKEPQVIKNEEVIEQKDEPLAEYKETLFTSKKSSKKSSNTSSSNENRYWRDVDSIEKKIDKLHITQAKKPTTELDKKVEKIIQKQKKK
jgi:hypothetical protein